MSRRDKSDIRIESSWKKELMTEFEAPYFQKLSQHIKQQYLKEKIYPPPKNIFRAFDLCPFNEVKVVIIGQDPYHGVNQANGLCFAVSDGVKIPPSLRNIYKEIESDLDIKPDQSGDLSRWAKQGVLMLNAVLTVLAGKPASHKGLGWEIFTDAVIQKLTSRREKLVYMLWGRYAQDKGSMIDREKNLVLTAAHPSPYSASGFLGCKHFSKCNQYLENNGKETINWK
jgi:uracil-DNA glycosylase